LTDIGVKIEIVPGARYRIMSAWVTINGNWDDVPAWAKKYQLDTLGGDRHAFGTCMDVNGLVLPKTFILSWPTGSDGRTPEADGWANLALAGQYWNPADGPGPYMWQAVNGWKLVGLGLPHNYHWSFFVRWQEAQGYVPSAFDRAAAGGR